MNTLLSPIVNAAGYSPITPGDWYLDAGGRNQVRRHNLAAATGPTTDDDSTAGYSVGSVWVDVAADVVYVCVDAAPGAAVWHASVAGAGTASVVPQWTAPHGLGDSPLSCSGNDVSCAGALAATGTVSGSQLQASSLTDGRVVYTGLNGLLQESMGLAYDGTRLRLTANDPPGTGILDLRYAVDDGAASIAWTTSAGTRVWRIGGGLHQTQSDLSFDEGTTSRLYLRSGGNVGIGTTTPQERLQVVGAVSAIDLKATSLTSGHLVYAATGGQLTGSSNLTFGAAGLRVNTTTTVSGDSGLSDGLNGLHLYFADNTAHINATQPGVARRSLVIWAADLRFQTRMGATAGYWDSLGRLGIGTTVQTSLLQVATGTGTTSARPAVTINQIQGVAGDTTAALYVTSHVDGGGMWFHGHPTEATWTHNAQWIIGTGWVARGTAASIVRLADGGCQISGATGLTSGQPISNLVTYMVLLATGQIGIGVTAPSARLHLAAGTAQASMAPMKFTAGTVLTTPEAGAEEYDGSTRYITLTNGARKGYVLDDGARLTSGRIPVAINGGRLVDGPTPAADGTYTNPTSITITNGLITAIS